MSNLVENMPEFVRMLRMGGMNIGPGDSADALRALSHLDLADRSAVYIGLRTVLVKSEADYSTYDAAFRVFFDGEVPSRSQQEQKQKRGESAAADEEEAGREGGYSPAELLTTADLATLGEAERGEALGVARRLARRLALRISRRSRTGRRGVRLALRETVRMAGRYGGLPLQLVRRRPRRKPANLVLILDVSGSMEMYSRILLQFVHALQSALPRVNSFCFATRLCMVSDELEEYGFDLAARRAREKMEGWGGGTRIGACLNEFAQDWGASLLGRRTAVIILSDGLDTGDPDQVGTAMARIRRSAGRVIWLNPLAGDSRYEPLARGMASALPYLDLLAPGHSLASLAALERELSHIRR